MGEFSVAKIDDIEAVVGGAFKRARAALGVTSFGMQVLDIPPKTDRYPEHDHAEDGQEEVYVTLSGGGEIEIAGQRHPLGPDTLVRVGPGVKRKIYPGEEGARVLAIGGVPGQAYDPPEVSQLGAPDPMPVR